MADKRKLGVFAAILLFLITAGAAFVIVKSYVWSGESAELPAAPANSAAVPATEPQPWVMPDLSKLKPQFTSADFQRDAVIMNDPHGKIGAKAGVYFIESSPGTFWVWNRPWGNMYSDFAVVVPNEPTNPETGDLHHVSRRRNARDRAESAGRSKYCRNPCPAAGSSSDQTGNGVQSAADRSARPGTYGPGQRRFGL